MENETEVKEKVQDEAENLPGYANYYMRVLEPLRKVIVNFRLRDVENAVLFLINTLLKLSSGAKLSQVFDITSMRPVGILLILGVLITHSVNNLF